MHTARLLAVLAALFAPVCESNAVGVDPNLVFQGESIPPDTIRITALGTGTPSVARKQAASSYLLQLGDGHTLLFDFGTGAMANLLSILPRQQLGTLDKVQQHCAAVPSFASSESAPCLEKQLSCSRELSGAPSSAFVAASNTACHGV